MNLIRKWHDFRGYDAFLEAISRKFMWMYRYLLHDLLLFWSLLFYWNVNTFSNSCWYVTALSIEYQRNNGNRAWWQNCKQKIPQTKPANILPCISNFPKWWNESFTTLSTADINHYDIANDKTEMTQGLLHPLASFV